MSNIYQKDRRRAQIDRLPGEVAVPEQELESLGLVQITADTGDRRSCR